MDETRTQPHTRLQRLDSGRPLRTIFMGSAPLSCPSLDTLLALTDVAAVVTQPDRPRGRRLRMAPCAVKAHLADSGIPILGPVDVNAPEVVQQLAAMQPDVMVVAAYGQFLRAPLLALPPLGCINVHASLLPRYRGAAPIQWALADGAAETGVTTIYMDAGMDSGDIILKRPVRILGDDTCPALHDRLALAGGELLAETLARVARGDAPREAQDHELATRAPRLRKEDGHMDWQRPAADLHNRARGFNPWPGTFTLLPGGGRLKIMKTAIETPASAGAPGTVASAEGAGPLVLCGAGALRLLEVQPAGGKVMPGDAYVRGHRVRPGDRLG